MSKPTAGKGGLQCVSEGKDTGDTRFSGLKQGITCESLTDPRVRSVLTQRLGGDFDSLRPAGGSHS